MIEEIVEEEQYFDTIIGSIAVCLVFSDAVSIFSVYNFKVILLQDMKDTVPIYLRMQEYGNPRN